MITTDMNTMFFTEKMTNDKNLGIEQKKEENNKVYSASWQILNGIK